MRGLTINIRERARHLLAALIAVAIALFTLVACTGDDSDDAGQRSEQKVGQSNYDRLAKQQPAPAMDYSPTRATLQFWAKTWGKNPNKTSYVYLQSASGDLLGYYVLKGLPVSYCASLLPNYKVRSDTGSDNGGNLVLPAPSLDGVYYSGGQCNSYFGRDASTGSYIEYTAGLGINVLLYDQPLPNNNARPLGPTKIKK